MKIEILKGLPASGKTTYALEKIKRKNGGWIRVNKDEIRKMVHADVFTKGNERITRKVEGAIIMEALDNGRSVIVDSTNLDPSNENRIRGLVEKFVKMKWKDVEIEVKTFNTTLEECIERDKKRDNPVGEDVIRNMHERYIGDEAEKVPYDPRLQNIVICDLDGTLAIHNGRSPYNASKCETDILNVYLARILHQYLERPDVHVVFLTGREDKYRNETRAWLDKNGFSDIALFMRKEGDFRKDSIVKKEIFDREIRGNFNVIAVFDDRLQVCRMWHSLGLPLFRVGDPDASF